MLRKRSSQLVSRGPRLWISEAQVSMAESPASAEVNRPGTVGTWDMGRASSLGFAIIATALTGCSTTEIISQKFGTLLATKETRGSAAVKADDAT